MINDLNRLKCLIDNVCGEGRNDSKVDVTKEQDGILPGKASRQVSVLPGCN